MKTHGLLLRSIAALLVSAVTAPAVIETISLSTVFSGAPHPAPISLQLEDGFGPDRIRLTLDASGLSDTEFISSWYVNLNPLLSASSLSFAIVANPTALTSGNIMTGTDTFKADGDGHYDLLFDLPPPPGQFTAKFTKNEQVIVDIIRAGGLTLADFHFQSVNSSGNGVYYSAAHIQGIGGASDTDPAGSAWIGASTLPAIPEPSTYAALAGLVVLAGAMLRKRHQAGPPGKLSGISAATL